jgi:hypothetical protein
MRMKEKRSFQNQAGEGHVKSPILTRAMTFMMVTVSQGSPAGMGLG